MSSAGLGKHALGAVGALVLVLHGPVLDSVSLHPISRELLVLSCDLLTLVAFITQAQLCAVCRVPCAVASPNS